jgi:hypothetical protein
MQMKELEEEANAIRSNDLLKYREFVLQGLREILQEKDELMSLTIGATIWILSRDWKSRVLINAGNIESADAKSAKLRKFDELKKRIRDEVSSSLYKVSLKTRIEDRGVISTRFSDINPIIEKYLSYQMDNHS